MDRINDFLLNSADRNTIISILKAEMSRTGFETNWVHGLPHVLRVEENFRIFLMNCENPEPNMKKMFLKLHMAVLFHDIKRGEAGDHALNGADFFRQLDLSFLSLNLSKEDFNDIAFAIENHNKGLNSLGIYKATEEREILLGLLIVFDGMDVIGEIGYLRIVQWYLEKEEKTDLFGKISNVELNYMIEGRGDFKNFYLKDQKALLPHLVFELCVSKEVISPIKHLLPKSFYNEISERKKVLEEKVYGLICLRETLTKEKYIEKY